MTESSPKEAPNSYRPQGSQTLESRSDALIVAQKNNKHGTIRSAGSKDFLSSRSREDRTTGHKEQSKGEDDEELVRSAVLDFVKDKDRD